MKQLLYFMVLLPMLAQTQMTSISSSVDGNNVQNEGINWFDSLPWQQVISKAKAEGKYIFIDCFASWCGPCKAMDKNVFSKEDVANVLNEKFLSIKVQMDTTAYDRDQIKKWYGDANDIRLKYTIIAFPTFLFFSPEGIPLHKGVGYKDPEQFKSLVKEVFSPDKRYYSVLSDFKPGKMDTAEMKGLARAFHFSGKELAEKIALDYLTRISKSELQQLDNLRFMMEFNESPKVQQFAIDYLNEIPENSLCSGFHRQFIESFKTVPEIQRIVLRYLGNLNNHELGNKFNLNLLTIFSDHPMAKAIADRYINNIAEDSIFIKNRIQFIGDFTKKTSDRGFKLFYKYSRKVDSVMIHQENIQNIYIAPDYAEIIVSNLISKEEIGPYWDKAITGYKINWKKITQIIRNKYDNEYADRVVLDAKISLYRYLAKKNNKNWSEFIKYYIQKINKYGTDTTSAFADSEFLNNFAWYTVFFHCNDKKELSIVIKWMEGVVRRHSESGSFKDTYANLLYKRGSVTESLNWEEEALKIAVKNNDGYHIQIYQDVITKMKKGEPTWNVK